MACRLFCCRFVTFLGLLGYFFFLLLLLSLPLLLLLQVVEAAARTEGFAICGGVAVIVGGPRRRYISAHTKGVGFFLCVACGGRKVHSASSLAGARRQLRCALLAWCRRRRRPSPQQSPLRGLTQIAGVFLIFFGICRNEQPSDVFFFTCSSFMSLHYSLSRDSFELPRGQPSRDGDIEMGTQPQMNSAELGLESFFKQVQDIEKQVDKLAKLLKKLQDANEESKAVTKASAMKAIRQRMEKDIDEVGKIARIAKTKLEELDKDHLKPNCLRTVYEQFPLHGDLAFSNLQIKCIPWLQLTVIISESASQLIKFLSLQTESRQQTKTRLWKGIRRRSFKNCYYCCTQEEVEGENVRVPGDTPTLREAIHQEYREVVERRVFTVTGNRADEENIWLMLILQTIDQLIETGDSEQIFQKAIQEQGRGQVMDTLAEIQERHDTVKEIERKLLELQQIFLDMSVLVEAQGDMLNNIESQVSSAVDHVQQGTTALQKAKRLQKNSRKWMCIAIIILLIIVAIIVVAVIKPWSSSKGA
ncbi:hypothetical protein Taro_033848 [Colocasia esculenta]|uniref:t-SNARE coiled-coil homology domain-containing protein n=1 Tax=Colocasia esculenta TaxID=4460 RepID=A0A843VUX9_COLES|nr:hypothetical protein [Colocasia esculenta]